MEMNIDELARIVVDSSDEGTEHAAARLMHSRYCRWNHTDGCSWEYETRWDGLAHKQWLCEVRDYVESPEARDLQDKLIELGKIPSHEVWVVREWNVDGSSSRLHSVHSSLKIAMSVESSTATPWVYHEYTDNYSCGYFDAKRWEVRDAGPARES